ncbi:hypothetical protein [Janthinobacterium sp. Ant5-2-1]|uniref:hypothetical protein n=1 Tax=Janthinobacterium sp. Ant5-2-1 TaxID=1755239 RepID=UPI000717E855|nr:hypothetical protein [Janthinobacterium sp. Ant5-2-1]
MITKIAITTAIFFIMTVSAQTKSAAQVGVEELAILYTSVKWGNAVDYGTALMPVNAYKSQAACDAAKQKIAEASLTEAPRQKTLVCQAAKTPDERALAQLLVVQIQKM